MGSWEEGRGTSRLVQTTVYIQIGVAQDKLLGRTLFRRDTETSHVMTIDWSEDEGT